MIANKYNPFKYHAVKYLPSLFLIIFIFYNTLGCVSKYQSVESDPLAQYRDTLIGNFNGLDIDTLITEPIGKKDGGWYFKWRVFTKNNSVKPLIIYNQTIGIHFVSEGDLDGNGTDEWGYITESSTSNWMNYHAFTNINGEWLHIIKPTSIWIPHLDTKDSLYFALKKEDILQSLENSDYLKVKYSDIRNDGEDFLIIDTLIQINPQRLDNYE